MMGVSDLLGNFHRFETVTKYCQRVTGPGARHFQSGADTSPWTREVPVKQRTRGARIPVRPAFAGDAAEN